MLAALAWVAAGASAQTPAPVVAPSTWLAALSQRVLEPGYRQAQAEAAGLEAGLAALCAAPGQEGALAALQDRWRVLMLRVRGLTPLSLGPVLEGRVLRQIDFWPTRPAQIETSIGQWSGLPAEQARIGVTAKGMPALEWLLFDPAARLGGRPAACRYAQWLAQEVARQLAPLPDALERWRGQLAGADGEAQAQALATGLNVLIGAVQALRVRHLEKPARQPVPQFDGWRAGQVRAQWQAYVAGLRTAIAGDPVTPGLVGLLRGRGLLVLADRLEGAMAQVVVAFAALPPVLSQEMARPALAAAGEALAGLQRLLAQDTADALKVMIGFGEGDGD